MRLSSHVYGTLTRKEGLYSSTIMGVTGVRGGLPLFPHSMPLLTDITDFRQ